MNKIKYFYNQVDSICSRFKIKKPVYIAGDKRLRGYVACMIELIHNQTKDRGYAIKYQPDKIVKLRKYEIIHVILHELGHFKTSGSTLLRKEYNAEKFALKMINKHYSKYYKKVLKDLEYSIVSNRELYSKVFSSLITELKK